MVPGHENATDVLAECHGVSDGRGVDDGGAGGESLDCALFGVIAVHVDGSFGGDSGGDEFGELLGRADGGCGA